jgi:hypothetical protein
MFMSPFEFLEFSNAHVLLRRNFALIGSPRYGMDPSGNTHDRDDDGPAPTSFTFYPLNTMPPLGLVRLANHTP